MFMSEVLFHWQNACIHCLVYFIHLHLLHLLSNNIILQWKSCENGCLILIQINEK